MKPKVIIVDDSFSNLKYLESILKADFTVDQCNDGKKALEMIQNNHYELLLCDYLMPYMDGMEITKELRNRGDQIGIIIITSHGSIENAILSVKAGADDFLTRPFENDELFIRMHMVLEKKKLREEIIHLKEDININLYKEQNIIGSSPAFKKVLQTSFRVAKTDAPVLITGESGTGKELIARSVHNFSSRKNGEFVAINCGAIPGELLETELFGHEKGAFTGAVNKKIGLFKKATGGTLFLDEIGEMPLDMQVKLLRALQEQEIRPIGSTQSITVDARIITATNRDLEDAVAKGIFRDDLFYRLNVIQLQMPALRERREDIPELCAFFLNKLALKYKRSGITLTEEAIKKIVDYSWPGNVRELMNKLESWFILTDKNEIDADTVNLSAGKTQTKEYSDFEIKPFKIAKEEFERNYLFACLKKYEGNVKKASEETGKDRKDFYYLMKKYDIDPNSYR